MIEPAYYQSKISVFLSTNQEEILGALANKHSFALDVLQKNSWLEQITNLKVQLHDFPQDDVFLEFAIPRMGKRVDVVLLICGTIFVVEYKVGAKIHDSNAIDQTIDYALDLKNFHEGSHNKFIIPILVSTKAEPEDNLVLWSSDCISSVLLSNGLDLCGTIIRALSETPSHDGIDPVAWARSGYKPTPTIVEAAQALYRGHSVGEISRSDAGTINLTTTSNCITEIIEFSKLNGKKSICFVMGVPGAGKTLAGLNISTERMRSKEEESSVFLSGNGPLVTVLREALARDEVARAKEKGQPIAKKAATSRASTFIQNIHHFRDDGLRSSSPPVEHVVVFDEAQRAWNQAHAEKFMIQKRGLSKFEMSEPEFLISLMDRRKDWCTIVCLIGGGQEINTGEAGLVEWVEALQKQFSHWQVYCSDQISQKEYSWGQNLSDKLDSLKAQTKRDLHLAVSVRSYRAERLSAFIGALIEGEVALAHTLYSTIQKDYPIYLTRDIGRAREWLRSKARGTERYGLVASSGGIRLKPEGINVKARIDPTNWFLNDKHDVRSSFYLEDAATEFDIQGLELDWTGVCWYADFRRRDRNWSTNNFKGTHWQAVHDPFRQAYLANAYRVLLTRARQGMVIFVPKGDKTDSTRPPEFYEETFEFLASCGITQI